MRLDVTESFVIKEETVSNNKRVKVRLDLEIRGYVEEDVIRCCYEIILWTGGCGTGNNHERIEIQKGDFEIDKESVLKEYEKFVEKWQVKAEEIKKIMFE